MYRQDDRIGVNNAKESVYIIFYVQPIYNCTKPHKRR